MGLQYGFTCIGNDYSSSKLAILKAICKMKEWETAKHNKVHVAGLLLARDYLQHISNNVYQYTEVYFIANGFHCYLSWF